MKRRLLIWGLALLACVLAAWWTFRPRLEAPTITKPKAEVPAPAAVGQGTSIVTPPPSEPEPASPPDMLPNVPVPRNMPATPYTAEQKGEMVHPEATQDIERVHGMLRDFRTLFGENPVGTNAEIMAALNGGNGKQARLGPPEGEGLNEKGELVDRWGTPYFFHQLDGQHMEIHSAGADKVLGTRDDVVMR